jgi:hypothetical protein
MNLIDELRAASADPPPTRIDLDGLMSAERRNMARRRWVVACAAVFTVAASVGVVRLASPPNLGNAPVTTQVPDFTHLNPPERVWPNAIRSLPGTLPDGRAYQVAAALDDGTYLVRAEPDPAKETTDFEGPMVYDPVRATTRHLFDPALLNGMTAGISTGLPVKRVGGEAVWLLSGVRAGKPVWELWAAPLDGGAPARRLASLTEETGGGMVMTAFDTTGDAVYWSIPSADGKPAGIRIQPLSGGAPRYVPGYDLTGIDGWVSTAHTEAQHEQPIAGELWNMVTDKRVSWRVSGASESHVCDPTACYGPAKGGWVTHELDGNGVARLGATFRTLSGTAFDGRFALGIISPELRDGARRDTTITQVLWDRSTDKAASRPIGFDGSAVVGTAERPLYTWRDGDVYNVLDLSAIG